MRPVALIFVLVLVATLGQASSATAQVISVTPTHIEFGNMKQMESRDAEVTVTNQGGGLLRINEVDADCGCTIPTLAKQELAPGESTVIAINFNSKKFSGDIIKMVHVYSNDPTNPVVDVMLTANVFAPLLIDPPTQRVGFSQSPMGEKLTKQVTFTATEAPQLEIMAQKSSKGLFEVGTVNNLDGNPQVAVLEVTIPADMEPGRQRDNVRVKTNLEEMPYVDIELSCWVVRQLSLSHEKVNFRYKRDLRQNIRLAPYDKSLEWKLTGAEIDMPEIEVKVENTIANQEGMVRLSGAPVDSTDPRAVEANGRMQGTLKIFTDLPDLPVIEIPVSYMVRM
jgi:hypothetical protein